MIWEFAEDIDPHADMVIHVLESRGAEVLRINPERLDERLCELSYGLDANGQIEGHLTYLKRQADLADIDAVFIEIIIFSLRRTTRRKRR